MVECAAGPRRHLQMYMLKRGKNAKRTTEKAKKLKKPKSLRPAGIEPASQPCSFLGKLDNNHYTTGVTIIQQLSPISRKLNLTLLAVTGRTADTKHARDR